MDIDGNYAARWSNRDISIISVIIAVDIDPTSECPSLQLHTATV